MRVHFVVHEDFEAPGAYLTWATERGHDVTATMLYAGDALPPDATGVDLLVVMGGPQSPTTTTTECPHFDSAAEQALVRDAISQGAAVVGVCLGAQLLGQALGGECVASPQREIGLFPIRLTEAGRADPLLAGFPDELPSGHWHGDMPGLTDDAVVLATSEGCPRQVVRYAPLAYAMQCHLEFTPELVEGLIAAETDLAAMGNQPFVMDAETLRRQDWAPSNLALYGFLDALASQMRP